ncbi:MAG: ATP-binding protein [Ruminococcus sp.]
MNYSIIQGQLNTAVAQAQGMHNADADTINRLTGVINSMKAERELSSREFKANSLGIIFCTEPSGKKKEVGYIKFKGSYLLVSRINNTEITSVVIEYETTATTSKTTVIPIEDVTRKKLIKHFPLFRTVCKNEIANDFLYSVLMDVLDRNPPVITIPEFPGITLRVKDNNLTGAEFTCSESDFPDIYNGFISEAYNTKHLSAVNKTTDKILSNLAIHLKSPTELILMIYNCAGIISTFLKFIHCESSLILSVSFASNEARKLAGIYLKTYDRILQPKSLTVSKYELTKVLNNSKDETVVFIDDTVSETCSKRLNSIDTILGYKSNADCKPFNIAVISKEIHYHLPQDTGIHIELDEDFGKEYSDGDRYELSIALNEMTRHFVDAFCKNIDEYCPMLQNNIAEIKKQERDNFSSDSFCTAYAVLLSVFYVWIRIFHTADNTEFKCRLKKLIQDSQDFEGGKSLAIINSFSKCLNHLITDKKLEIIKLGRDMNYKPGSDTVIVDGELMMMEESVMKKFFLPEITDAQTVNGILSILAKHNCLVATNGHKKPTTVYDDKNNPIQKNLIAFRFADMVNNETIKYIESLSNKKYFTNEINIPDFIPLIQNVFGYKAGQLLQSTQNQHRCITGKSGSGKTVFLAQLMARLAMHGNRVVVFDGSNSFSKSELEGKLSKEFIEEHITFYDASKSGLPVHLLYTYENDTPNEQRDMLTNIFCEAIHNSTQNQLLFLKKIIKRYINYYHCNYKEFYELLDCPDANKGESRTKESILNKIGMVLYELMESGSDGQAIDWLTFLSKCKDIVIINIEEAGKNNGNQLTDMLLASLFYAQKHQSNRKQLSIFIDEIQNQNLSNNSIISHILREGRKYSIDLNYATQYISNINESRLLRQASLNICFRPECTSRNALADMLGLKKTDIWQLDNMNVGECFVQGSMVDFDNECSVETVIKGTTCLLPDSPLSSK